MSITAALGKVSGSLHRRISITGDAWGLCGACEKNIRNEGASVKITGHSTFMPAIHKLSDTIYFNGQSCLLVDSEVWGYKNGYTKLCTHKLWDGEIRACSPDFILGIRSTARGCLKDHELIRRSRAGGMQLERVLDNESHSISTAHKYLDTSAISYHI